MGLCTNRVLIGQPLIDPCEAHLAGNDSFLARPNSNETKSARHDETWNECWDLGNGLLPVSQGTDHQRNDPRSSWSPDGPASREGKRATAECALGNRSG